MEIDRPVRVQTAADNRGTRRWSAANRGATASGTIPAAGNPRPRHRTSPASRARIAGASTRPAAEHREGRPASLASSAGLGRAADRTGMKRERMHLAPPLPCQARGSCGRSVHPPRAHVRQHARDGVLQPLQAVGHAAGGVEQFAHLALTCFQHADEVFQHLLRVHLREQEIPARRRSGRIARAGVCPSRRVPTTRSSPSARHSVRRALPRRCSGTARGRISRRTAAIRPGWRRLCEGVGDLLRELVGHGSASVRGQGKVMKSRC